jgi:transposase
MSLKVKAAEPIPMMTAQVAKAAFPKGNIYMAMRDHFGVFFKDEQFQELYSHTGQPAKSPWRLALLTIMQYCENLTDRQAADAVRSRIDWKYALSLELTDPGFGHTTLTKFRKRLVEEEQQTLLFDSILQSFIEHDLLSSGNTQRTDSTHVLSAVRELNQLEALGETVRAALNALSSVVPLWIQERVPGAWFVRYERPFEEFRLPKKRKEREKLAIQIGEDGHILLDWVFQDTEFPWLRDIPAVDFLRRKWIQSFFHDDDGQLQKRTSQNIPKSSDALSTPHDEDARSGRKRELRWVGYKVHFTESCDENKPRLITDVKTTKATTNDVTVLEEIHNSLKERNLLPREHLVDMGYTSGKQLVTSKERGVDLIGPLARTSEWQAGTEGGLTNDKFVIDWGNKVVICPMNRRSKGWERQKTRRGKIVSKVWFDKKECDVCEVREKCTRGKVNGRTLRLLPKAEYELLKKRKEEQKGEDFGNKYKKRGGVEGAHSQGVSLGLRRAKYRGMGKTKLQHLVTGAAMNIMRVMSWLLGVLPSATKVSSFALLAPA